MCVLAHFNNFINTTFFFLNAIRMIAIVGMVGHLQENQASRLVR
jgi:hypothetical protein